jgi:hypothetical protein
LLGWLSQLSWFAAHAPHCSGKRRKRHPVAAGTMSIVSRFP